ncbi:MAG: hypothetical protein H0W52_16000 [Rubrobacteraceae bacterium]|nr:hypothetical protein [Rubrobacteraceae bacterium]
MEEVEIVDPTHPLHGKTLPLVGITTRQRLGRVAVVWLYPGVERCVPLSATDLAEIPPASPSPSRLSVASLERLLAVVASLPQTDAEDADDGARTGLGTDPKGARATDAALRAERTEERRRRTDRSGDRATRGVEGPFRGDEGDGPSGLPAHDAGGAR